MESVVTEDRSDSETNERIEMDTKHYWTLVFVTECRPNDIMILFPFYSIQSSQSVHLPDHI